MSNNLPYNKIDKNKFLLIGEAASLLGVSIDTLRRWDKAGKIRSVRPDGKNRYFAISDLRKLKNSKPLSISGAAKKMGVSASTLRRYEVQDLINPKRNSSGERIYSQDTIDEFYRRKERIVQKKAIEEAKATQEIKEEHIEKAGEVRQKPVVKSPTLETEKSEGREIKITIPSARRARSAFKSFTTPKFSLSHVVLAAFIIFTSSLSFRYLKDHAPEYRQQAYQKGEQVLGIADDARGFFSKIGGFFAKTTSNITTNVADVAEQARVAFSGGRITDINQVFELDEEGNLVPKITLNITQPELLKITETKETRVIQNLDAETVQGKKPGVEEGDLVVFSASGRITALRVDATNIIGGVAGLITDDSITADELALDSVTTSEIKNGTIIGEDIADGAITGAKIVDGAIGSGEIADGTITGVEIESGAIGSDEIASGVVNIDELADTLTFADGNFIDLSAVLHDDTGLQGLRLPNVSSASPAAPGSGEGFLAYDTAGNQALVYDGSAWTPIGGGVTLYTTVDDNTTTSSISGLEILSDEISLIRGCADTQVLKWNDTAKTWGCGDDSGAAGSGISTVQENNVTVISSATQADFSSDFNITDNGGGEVGIAIDFTNSGMTRKSQTETVTGAWTFSNTVTFNGDITANDASADTILIGQSGVTDDTVTIAGNVSITDDDWGISATGVATGLSGVTADDLVCTNCIGATEVADLTLGTDTAGNYVATLTSGSGVSATATGEGSTPTIALAPLTANWSQAGAFDIVLGNAGSELQILESVGATYYGTVDVGDLGANATYTFSGATGTVLTDSNAATELSGWDQDSSDDLTTTNYTTTLDSVYVNVGESPGSGDIAGSFSSGLTIGSGAVAAAELAATITWSDGDLVDFSSITPNTATEGLKLTQSTSCTSQTAEGLICWDSDNDTLYVGNGAGVTEVGSGGGGSVAIEENNISVVAVATSVDFLGADFAVTDAGGGEADVAIDYANSGITRDNQTETVSGAWTFSNLTVSDTTVALSGGSTTFDMNSGTDTIFAITNSGVGAGKFRVDGLVSCNTIDTDASGNFTCGTDEGGAGGGIATIKENNTNVVTSALVVDFLGADFAVTDAGGGEGDIAIDYTNSGITRKDQAETVTGDWGFTLAGTESFDISSDLAGTVNVVAVTGTPSSTAGTTYGMYIDQANSANTNGLDAAVVIDNSDVDLAIPVAIKIVDAGGGFTNVIDNAGTLISGAELDILDGGVLLSELTDTGTLTATTVDIGGGNIDGTVLGATTPAVGTFTTITGNTSVSTPTLSLTGTGTINGLDSIDVTTETTLEGAIDIAGDVSGTGLGSVTIGADKVLESHLKAVDVAGDEECLTYETTTGDFEWQTCGGAGGGAWSDLTVATADLALSQGDWTTALSFNTASDTADNFFGLDITNDLVTDTQIQRLLTLTNTDDAIGTGTTEALLYIDNADANEVVTAAIQIANTGGGGYTNILDTPSLDISGAGVITGATGVSTTTITASAAIAANGGITFDNSTDTLGAFTAAGNIDLNTSYILTNIGAAGTNFSGTGGLTLADALSVSSGGVGVTSGGISVTAGALAVNSDSITSDGTLTIDGTDIVRLGDATNYFQVDEANGPSYAGTARPTKRVTISPEFDGATLTADGSSNIGTMTSDSMAATLYKNYYNWTTTQGTSQDYDIWIRVPLPADFDAMSSANAIVVETWSDSLANTTATIDVYDTGNTSDCTGVSIETTTVSTWEDATPTGCTGGTYVANGIMTIQVKLGSVSSSNIRLGRIYFDYEAKF